jgi:hypothetical protein
MPKSYQSWMIKYYSHKRVSTYDREGETTSTGDSETSLLLFAACDSFKGISRFGLIMFYTHD